MPVATLGAIRGQSHGALERTGAKVILANTYHLMLLPGVEVLERFGGLPGLMGWKNGILTDSGGFQIFSLPNARKMTEAGAEFQSYVNGDRHLLTPERSIAVQRAIGSDIRMVLDQCVPSTCDVKTAVDAMELTHRWALRSLIAHGDDPQSTFAIVQGACFPKLRKESAEYLTQLEHNGKTFDGFAIGGLAVGETRSEREEMTALAASFLPQDRPRYLMGVGTPLDLLEGVRSGVDLFDCIIPSAWAQQGSAFSWRGRIDLGRGVYKFSDMPIDPGCDCLTCTTYTRAFLHHLVKSGEALAWSLIGEHNLRFYQRFTAQMRAAIIEDRFDEYYRFAKPILESGDDLDHPKLRPSRDPKKVKTRHQTELGDYEVVSNPTGTYSIRQKSSGEVMHSVSDPAQEAHELYVEQPQIRNRVQSRFETQSPALVVWDVGMGAGHNAMAVVSASEPLEGRLELVSFENDLHPMELALRFPMKFPHLRHAAPRQLMESESLQWTNRKGNVTWRLFHGDFREHYRQASMPDVILFDPFSHKSSPALWSVEFFTELHDHLKAHAVSLYTYSNSTAVRAALVTAGFWVAAGRATGPKSETTIAFTEPGWTLSDRSFPLLDEAWLSRWERSSARLPLGAREEDRDRWEALVRSAPQFKA